MKTYKCRVVIKFDETLPAGNLKHGDSHQNLTFCQKMSWHFSLNYYGPECTERGRVSEYTAMAVKEYVYVLSKVATPLTAITIATEENLAPNIQHHTKKWQRKTKNTAKYLRRKGLFRTAWQRERSKSVSTFFLSGSSHLVVARQHCRAWGATRLSREEQIEAHVCNLICMA